MFCSLQRLLYPVAATSAQQHADPPHASMLTSMGRCVLACMRLLVVVSPLLHTLFISSPMGRLRTPSALSLLSTEAELGTRSSRDLPDKRNGRHLFPTGETMHKPSNICDMLSRLLLRCLELPWTMGLSLVWMELPEHTGHVTCLDGTCGFHF